MLPKLNWCTFCLCDEMCSLHFSNSARMQVYLISISIRKIFYDFAYHHLFRPENELIFAKTTWEIMICLACNCLWKTRPHHNYMLFFFDRPRYTHKHKHVTNTYLHGDSLFSPLPFPLRNEKMGRVSGAFSFGRRIPQSTSWSPEEQKKIV